MPNFKFEHFRNNINHFREQERQRLFKSKISPLNLPSDLFQPISPQVPQDNSGKSIMCEVQGRHFLRSLLMLNREKMQYCYTLFRKMKEINTAFVLDSINQTKVSNLNILDLKKTVYCFVCDAHQQRMFNNTHKLVIFEQSFCRDLLNAHADYIKWVNVYLVQLMDQLFQIMECFASKGNDFALPYRSKIDYHKRMMFFIQRCLDYKDGDQFMFYCHFICTDFKFHGYSQYWDGNLKLVQEMAVHFHEFATQMGLNKVEFVQPLNLLLQFSLNRDQKIEPEVGRGFSASELREKKIEGDIYALQ